MSRRISFFPDHARLQLAWQAYEPDATQVWRGGVSGVSGVSGVCGARWAHGLYFDANTHILRGCINTSSARYNDRFRHERLTSALSLSFNYETRMTRKDVYARIGQPTRIIAAPEQETKSLYDDHFWQRDSTMAPIRQNTPTLDVYEYALENGGTRQVFVGYTRANNKLIIFGYDHAWEEGERYTRQQQQPGVAR